jgi:esterase/lipase
MKKNIQRLILFLLFLVIAIYLVGSYLTKAYPSTIGAIPTDLKNIRAVSFPSRSGSELSGWLLEAKKGKGGVLLLHGVKSNRLQMLSRARFLQKAGYDVLLFDFQAHGESNGTKITFGYLESLDAESAYDYLADRVCNPNGVIGVSLGGASALLGKVKSKAKVMILESVYPTIEEAIDNRLVIRFGSFGIYLSPLLTMQLKPRFGFDMNGLKPIEHIKNVKGAVMIITGTKDNYTTLKESKQMFKEAKEPKVLWVIEGKGHVNFDEALGDEYEERVLTFLEEWMKN